MASDQSLATNNRKMPVNKEVFLVPSFFMLIVFLKISLVISIGYSYALFSTHEVRNKCQSRELFNLKGAIHIFYLQIICKYVTIVFMKKDKHIKPSKSQESSSNKTLELRTFNDLGWDLVDEVNFGHTNFIKVANLDDEASIAQCGCSSSSSSSSSSTGGKTTGSVGMCTFGCG